MISALEAGSHHHCSPLDNHIQVRWHGHGIHPSHFWVPVFQLEHLLQSHPVGYQSETLIKIKQQH